ncbi:MAG: 5-formyltetrahydrofolate cyclo-ligase [Planctomycetes bacterium]|nr:5-formyltetrahydrofolate cyclo-ligase [Planctomycetota bacterium]
MKKELRSKLKAVLEGMSPDVIRERSARAAQKLIAEPEYQHCEVMMIYLSLPNEADTTALVLNAWRTRKRVLAPQVGWETKQMMPVEINNLDTDVAASEYGIREPIRGTPFPIELIDLVIVPGVGFDHHGNRLGRGRGFYDRFLSRPNFRGTFCGFALEEQVVESLPADPHDVKVHMLVTDAQVRRFR